MPVQCNQGWLADLRLCGPFSKKMKELFHWHRNRRYRLPFAAALIHARHNALLLVLNWNVNFGNWATGPWELALLISHFSLGWGGWFSGWGGELTLDSPRVTTPCVRLGSDWEALNAAYQSFFFFFLANLNLELDVEHHAGGKRWNLRDTSRHPGSSHYWSRGRGGKSSSFWAAGVSEAGQHSAVQPRRNERISRARQIHMTGIKQHNQIVCATI